MFNAPFHLCLISSAAVKTSVKLVRHFFAKNLFNLIPRNNLKGLFFLYFNV